MNNMSIFPTDTNMTLGLLKSFIICLLVMNEKKNVESVYEEILKQVGQTNRLKLHIFTIYSHYETI